MGAVELRDVTKSYQNGPSPLTVLRDITVTIPRGSVAVITGASGSGKSTLLNLIGGLDRATSGEIECEGRRIDLLGEAELTDYRGAMLGFIFQFHYLLRDFTALENVMMPAYMRGVPRKDAERRAAELLAEVDLSGRSGHFPSQLSGGERQRTAVARADQRPSLVLADEPTGNLDAENSAIVERMLLRLVQERHATLVMVTHNRELAQSGDHRYFLEGGALLPQ